MASFRDYCGLISTSEGLGERQNMLAALTTNVTRFFREPHDFEHLEKKVLPSLIAAARRGARLRLWSAGNGLRLFVTAASVTQRMDPIASHLN
jgi:chemotaxis protein methyltransferase CheR